MAEVVSLRHLTSAAMMHLEKCHHVVELVHFLSASMFVRRVSTLVAVLQHTC